jgi:hypothetical protein
VSDEEMSVVLLESLQRANPVPVDDVANRRDLPSAHALFSEITSQRPRRVRRRTMVIVIALVVLALAALVGAFAVVNRSDPAVTASPVCYGAPSLTSRAIVTPSGGDLRAACAELWKDGDFGAGPVPKEFDVCVLPEGAPAVFPGEAGSVCGTLGLPAENTTRSHNRFRDFMKKEGKAVTENCIGYREARDMVTRDLEQAGFDGWTVGLQPDTVPFDASNPCASLTPAPDQKTIFIVPLPLNRPGEKPPPTTG